MPRYTVVANVFDANGNETRDKALPIDAPDRETAHMMAADQLAQRYEQVSIKEVRGSEDNPVRSFQAALRADPDFSKRETVQAAHRYFKATNQAWLCAYLKEPEAA